MFCQLVPTLMATLILLSKRTFFARDWSRDAFSGFVGQALVKGCFFHIFWSGVCQEREQGTRERCWSNDGQGRDVVSCWSSVGPGREKKKACSGCVSQMLIKDAFGQVLVTK